MFAASWSRLNYYRTIGLFPQKRIRSNTLYTGLHWICTFVWNKPSPTLMHLLWRHFNPEGDMTCQYVDILTKTQKKTQHQPTFQVIYFRCKLRTKFCELRENGRRSCRYCATRVGQEGSCPDFGCDAVATQCRLSALVLGASNWMGSQLTRFYTAVILQTIYILEFKKWTDSDEEFLAVILVGSKEQHTPSLVRSEQLLQRGYLSRWTLLWATADP